MNTIPLTSELGAGALGPIPRAEHHRLARLRILPAAPNAGTRLGGVAWGERHEANWEELVQVIIAGCGAASVLTAFVHALL